MVLLIDTNVILDVILKRELFFEKSDEVIRICCENSIETLPDE